jgi:phosphate transport system substrate-binding protein
VPFPALACAVGILYNNSTVASLNLTDSQVCAIFSGQVTNWGQLVAGHTEALTVVYRSDGSGTTFSLSNHLAAVCSLASGHFVTDQTFSPTVLGSITPSGAAPANFSPANGNPAVVNAINATANSIGYGEIADAVAHNPTITHATVNGLDPLSDFATSGTFSISTTVGQVITGVNATTGKPTLGAISGGAQTQCVVIADPNGYSNPTGYPIVAVSNLLSYYGANANVSDVRYVLSGAYDTTVQAATTTIAAGTGLSWVSDASGNANAAKVTSCVN